MGGFCWLASKYPFKVSALYRRILCDPLNDLSFSLDDNCIINNYPFKNIVTISKTDVTMSYLSFVLHTLFSFQGAISESLVEFRFQYLNLLFKYWNLLSSSDFLNLLLRIGIFLLTRNRTKRCISIHASASDKVKRKIGGLKWTRTIDLPLIRRTL